MCASAERPLWDRITNKRYGTSGPTGSPRRRMLGWWERLQKIVVDWKTSRERDRERMVPNRTIHINNLVENRKKFCSNKISTTKYNILTFLPFFLFDQFRRYANLFFLFIVALQVRVFVSIIIVDCTSLTKFVLHQLLSFQKLTHIYMYM